MSAARPLKVLGVIGSLRKSSNSGQVLAAARELAPEGMEITPFDLADIPLYNQDLDQDGQRPESVERFKRALREADAVLFSTPEYNHSVPGVLQNAIDWASRPAGRSALAGKPVGMIGVSPGALGAARAQQQLKLVLLSTLSAVHPHPGVSVGLVREKLDASGKLVHPQTREFLRSFLLDFEAWARRVGPAR